MTLLLGACAAGAQTMSTGMQAHVDPQSGALVPEAVGPVARALPAPPPPTAAEIPAPGGGMMVDIRGRFMSSAVATIAADGSLHVDCVTSDHAHVHE